MLACGYNITANFGSATSKGTGWEAAVYVSNLLNTIGETDLPAAVPADLATTRRYTVNQPRTVGLSLNLKY